MRTLLIVGGIVILTAVPPAIQAPSEGAVTLAITGSRIIDMVDGSVQPGMTAVIRGDRIVAVGRDAATAIPSGARVIDAAGRFIIPGLWDMHIHTFMGKTADRGRDITLPLLVVNGVTGVRDMGSDLEAILRAREDIATHQLIGPRMVVAGPMLDGPQTPYTGALPIASQSDGRHAVAMLKSRGVDFIKVQSRVPRDAYFVIADECERDALPLAGHVPDSIRATEAVAAHQASFEHLIGVFEGSSLAEEQLLQGPKSPGRLLSSYDERKEESLTRRLVEHRVWQTPTLYWERMRLTRRRTRTLCTSPSHGGTPFGPNGPRPF